MSDGVKIVIPARYGSTRLPGKPLRLLAGVPMVVHTARRALETGFEVVVAHDDVRIGEVLAHYDIPAILTDSAHENGTQRLHEVWQRKGWADDVIVVNVQGDEPLLPKDLIFEVVKALQESKEAMVATLSTPFAFDESPLSPHMVKVVCDLKGHALYFSRSLLPYVREAEDSFLYQRHIGIYAYRGEALKSYINWQASPLECVEKLEQLRFLEYGVKVAVRSVAKAPPAGVDCEEDVARVEQVLLNS